MKELDTKTILNVTLIVGIFVVGKKLMELFGLKKTQDEITAEELDVASTGNTADVSPTAPSGLALNPKYWESIYIRVNSQFRSQGKAPLTGAQINQSLMFEPYQPLTYNSFQQNVIDFDFAKNEMIKLQKLKNIYSYIGVTYLRAVYQLMIAKGLFKDKPSIAFSVFQKMKSKAQVSYLSKWFTIITGQDLSTYLKSFLDATELTKISNIITNLKLV